MKNSNDRRLKRSPFIRFIRGVLRLFKVLFRPKQKNLRSAEDYQHELRAAELDRRQRQAQEPRSVIEEPQEQLITVGEVFKQVKWKDASSTVLDAQPLEMGMSARSRDASLN
ncbi:hypothetical protein [Chamaesiphon sp. VAR_69_metabat_338]|uniref:hypothetical protein n=1 Tax=Chamaesiphon sp. VAR_69_metabat_338 TaxID=2964704 RepID=UPI00286E5561|nr:hypothetical protein [Chamaesiphon sp. VAR_69_metabat_338]